MHISFAAENLFHIGFFPITNSFLTTLFVSSFLLIFTFIMQRKIALVPGRFQNATELAIESFYTLTSQIAGKRTSIIFPWFATFFIFILIANWSGLLPGFGTIGFFQHHEKSFVPLLRPVNSDLNVTLALAIISLSVTHFYSLRLLGMGEYLGRFFSLNPINLFVGVLEFFLEFVKIVSLSFRLFGNIYAGETLLITVSTLAPITAFIVPLPFMVLEVVVGFVQALVFSMLTMVFMVIFTTPHSQH